MNEKQREELYAEFEDDIRFVWERNGGTRGANFQAKWMVDAFIAWRTARAAERQAAVLEGSVIPRTVIDNPKEGGPDAEN